MATKKDLVEAYSFSRRRLITAFVSGAPGGREVEPARPGRSIVGGVALAVLLVAGGAVLGILKTPSTIDFNTESLVRDKESSQLYLNMLKPGSDDDYELRSLANITSAMLIFGPNVEFTSVDRSKIEDQDQGQAIGIQNAPATPARTDKLIPTGWTVCAGDDDTSGLKVDISSKPDVRPDPDLRFLVRTAKGEETYLVAEARSRGFDRGVRAYAYRIPSPNDGLLNEVAGTATVVTVPDNFVQLFPQGGDLDLESLGAADGYGKPWPGRGDVPGAQKAVVGGVLDAGGETFLLTQDGAVRLDAFSADLYATLKPPQGRRLPPVITVSQGPLSSVVSVGDIDGLSWPQEAAGTYSSPTGNLCAELDADGDQPGVRLATAADTSRASATGVEQGQPLVTVESGHGAFVWSGDFTPGGESQRFLVDSQGGKHAVGPGDEQANLGYADVARTVVPDSWLDLLPDGVPLTIEAARCPPGVTGEEGCA